MKNAQVEELWKARQARTLHPDGHFEYKGRYPHGYVVAWWPSEWERCSCCMGLYRPTRLHPYTLMVHCRTKRHIKQLLAKQIFPVLPVFKPNADIVAARAAARQELAAIFGGAKQA